MRACRGILVVGLALAGVACGERGPGYFAAYMVHFEPSNFPMEVQASDWPGPATVVGAIPSGDLLVDTTHDGRWVVDRDSLAMLDRVPGGLVWITPSGIVTAETRDAPVLHRYGALDAPEPIPLPADLDVVNDFGVDTQRERIYAAGVSLNEALGAQGMVHESRDWGQSWEVVGNLLQPLQGEVASVVFVGVVGFQRVGVCPPSGIYEGGSPVCEDYRLSERRTGRGYVYNLPIPFGIDADGRVLARCSPEAHGRMDLGVVVLDPEDSELTCEQLEPVLSGFIPEAGEIGIDLDGHLWKAGWNLDGYGLFRTSEPAGRSHDQRDHVLAGWGCEDYYRADIIGGSEGRDIEATVVNGLDEPILFTQAFDGRVHGPIPDTAPAVIAPGESWTASTRDQRWMMALTLDGRCAGFGQVKKLNGRTLR